MRTGEIALCFAFLLGWGSAPALASEYEDSAHSVPSLQEKAPQDSIQADALLCGSIEPGYYVRNTRCEVIGDTGEGGLIGIAYQRNIECVGQNFVKVPGLGGYVASEAVRFGVCTGP